MRARAHVIATSVDGRVPKKINRAYPMTAGAVFECVLV